MRSSIDRRQRYPVFNSHSLNNGAPSTNNSKNPQHKNLQDKYRLKERERGRRNPPFRKAGKGARFEERVMIHKKKATATTETERTTLLLTHYSWWQRKSGRTSHSHGDDDGHNQKEHHHNKRMEV